MQSEKTIFKTFLVTNDKERGVLEWALFEEDNIINNLNVKEK